MQIILLERVNKLGNIGSLVKVKDGFARNYLIPKKKALRATKINIDYFEAQKAEIERVSAEKKAFAESNITKFDAISVTIVRQAGEDGRLYGSVSNTDIAKAVQAKTGFELSSDNITSTVKLKEIGQYQIEVSLHPEVKTTIDLVISRNEFKA